MDELLNIPSNAVRRDVIIAIGQYSDEAIPNILCCENDAAILGEALSKILYLNGRVADQKIISTGNEVTDCTKNRLLNFIEASTLDLSENDMLVLVITCHGCTIDNETYILPYDAVSSDSRTLIGMEWIKGILDGCNARFKIVLIDACHSGDHRVTFKAGSGSLSFDEKCVPLQKFIKDSKGVVYATACTHAQVAQILPNINLSVWVKALAESIESYALESNDDEIIRFEPIISRAMHQTMWDSLKYCKYEQTPYCASKIEGIMPLGLAMKTEKCAIEPIGDDIAKATLAVFESRFKKAFKSDMPIESDKNLTHILEEKGFPYSHVFNVGPDGSRVRLAVTFDLMAQKKPDEGNLCSLQDESARLSIDRVIVAYIPPVSSKAFHLSLRLERLHLVSLNSSAYNRDRMFSDFYLLHGTSRTITVAANEYTDILLRRMGKLFHIVLADIAAPSYDDKYGKTSFGTAEAMAFEDQIVTTAIAKLSRKEFAVDLGCGTGRHTFEIARHFSRVDGLDFSPGMIQVANNKKREFDLNKGKYKNVSFLVRDVEDVPIEYPSESVDLLAACFGMGSFIEDLVPFLTNVKEQLRPGGKAVFSFYNREALVYSVPPPWRDCSLSAVLHPERQELEVTLPSGDKFRIFCRAYTYAEVKGQLLRIFDEVLIHSCPTFGSFLPSQYFADGQQGDRAKLLISHIDRELANHTIYPVGAYFTAVCSKDVHPCTGREMLGGVVSNKGEDELLSLLSSYGISHEVVEHRRVRNIKDLQKELDVPPSFMAKAILAVRKTSDQKVHDHVVFVLPGSHKLDLELAGMLLDRARREWRFATQKEVKDTYGLEIGGVPPFGYGPAVKIYIDRRLVNNEFVYCGIGNPKKSIRIRTEDLLRVSKAEVTDISYDEKI